VSSQGSSFRHRAGARQVVTAAALAVPLLWAAFNGGAYDIVPRQQLGIVVWWVIAVGAATGFLPRTRMPRAALVPVAGFGLLLALTAASLGWTTSAEATTAELARVALYAGVVVLVLAVVDRETWKAVATALVAVAVIVALASTASRLSPGLADHAVERTLNTTRLSYPLNYWNGVGAWAAIAAAMALIVSAHVLRPSVRALALASVPGCTLAVYLTYSRASVIDLAFGLGLALLLGRNRWTTALHAAVAGAAAAGVVLVVRGQPAIADATGTAGAGTVALALVAASALCGFAAWLTSRIGADTSWRMAPVAARKVAWGGVAVACAAFVLLAATGVTGRAWAQFKTPAAGTVAEDPSARLANVNSLRYELWKTAGDAWKAHPVDGIGPGTYQFWWNQHATSPLSVRDAHSLYLENLAELGVGGLAAVLLMAGGLLGLAIAARRRLRSPPEIAAHGALVAAAVIFLVHAGLDWLWETTALALLGLGCAAAAAAPLARPAERPLSLRWRLPVTIVALVLCLVQLPGLVGTLRERAATRARERGDAAAALSLSTEAIRAEPWAAGPLALRAQLLQRAGRTDAARVDLRRAIDAEPANWRHWFVLARLEAASGRGEAAVDALAHARRLNPLARPFR
jgi:O-antigen ligase